MKDRETSEFITDGFEGISARFTNVEVVKRTEHNVLVRAQRYGQWWMLKGLLPEEAGQPVYQEMLRKELELMLPLQHPNIVRAFEMDNVEGIGPCIVMDWVDGLPLDEYLRTAHPSRHEQRRLLEQLMDAVAYIHLHGIVHRDLKPQNIMVTRNGSNIKVIDFGLADADSYAVLKQPSGTAAYMAPEQAEGSAPDVRNDIYSMGKIMEQMHLGHDFDSVVRRCTEPIDRRYHNMDELRMAMKTSLLSRRWVRGVVAVLLAIIVVAGGVYFLTRPPEPVYVTDLSQLSNTKQYFIHTRRDQRGSLGVKARCLATTFERALQYRCERSSPFAIIQYEGSFYLYSVADRRYIKVSFAESDAPMAFGAVGDCALDIHQQSDSCFVIDFKACKTVCSLNVNTNNGLIVTDYGTINGLFDDGNMFMFEEAGEFDPTEALAMMEEPNAEYTAALAAITPGRYVIYTETSPPRRYYLKSDGRLTPMLSDSCVFTISLVEQNTEEAPPYRLPVWLIVHQPETETLATQTDSANGDAPREIAFGAPQVETDTYVPEIRHLRADPPSHDSWQDKVFFLGDNGCYAIRATNVPIEKWGAGLFWAVYDFNNDGLPEADYSNDRAYVWKISKWDQ